MTCTRCQQPITREQKYYRTKKGSHHAECPRKRLLWSLKDLAQGAKEIAEFIEWDREMIDAFHLYAQRFNPGGAGSNVYKFALEDALRYRGMTLERLRKP